MDESEAAKTKNEAVATEFKTMTTWMSEGPLKEYLEKVIISTRLTTSPCAVVAGTYGWSGNMERIMSSQTYQKHNDVNNQLVNRNIYIYQLNNIYIIYYFRF